MAKKGGEGKTRLRVDGRNQSCMNSRAVVRLKNGAIDVREHGASGLAISAGRVG